MNKKQHNKVAAKTLELRNKLWPEIKEESLWNRHNTGGWLTIPKTLPIVLKIMDTISKGKPVSQTYLDLWCRTHENSFLVANKHSEMAFSSGFNGERAIRTWKDRIKILEELGFVKVKEGPSGPISYILILNPHNVIKQLEIENKVDSSSYNALIQRAIEIGAKDIV